MKNVLLATIVLIAICVVGSWEYSLTNKERVNSIPDSVYEYIYLKVGDNCTDMEILNYYDNHRMECDSVEIANL